MTLLGADINLDLLHVIIAKKSFIQRTPGGTDICAQYVIQVVRIPHSYLLSHVHFVLD